MKFYIFILINLLGLFLNSHLFGQCKYSRNEKDEFTGAIVKETKFSGQLTFDLVGRNCNDCGYLGRICFAKIDSILILKVYVINSNNWSIISGNEGLLKMENGDIIPIISLDNVIGKNTSLHTSLSHDSYEESIRFKISSIYWNKLKSSPEKLRIYFSGGYDNAVFDKGGKKKFIQDLQCVFE